MNGSDTKPTSHDTAQAVMGLLSRTGPEVPPDVADGPPHAANEPTALLPVVHRPAPAVPPKVAARAVIVYEPEPRPRRGLWVFTAVLVALTSGVVLGQTSAYRPVSRSVATAQTEPLPAPEAVPSPPPQVTAPLGAATSRTIEVTGAATLLRIRSADLGDLLFSATTTDGGVPPAVEETGRGPRLGLSGPAAEVLLHSSVQWTVRLTGAFTDQQVDMRAGDLAGLELTGGADRAALELPRPAGAVPVRLTGAVRELRVRAGADVPVRVRLGRGADTAVLDGTSRRDVRSGTALTTPGWRSAKDRYDVSARVRMDSVLVHHEP